MTKLQAILRRRQRRRGAIPVLQASVVVLAALALVFFTFTYHDNSSDRKKQSTVLSVVHAEKNREFFRQLDLHDPARIYSSGKRKSDPLPGRYRHAEFTVETVKPEKLPEVLLHAYYPVKIQQFPVSARLGVAPENPKPPAVKTKIETVIITPDGRVIHDAALQALKENTVPAADSVINISRRGGADVFRVMHSCGAAELDTAAGKELIRRNGPEGIYTVIWRGREVKK